MKKKILVLALAAVFVSLLALGSAAYFTVEGRASNIITTGKVDMALHEMQLVPGADGQLVEDEYPDQPITGVMPGRTVSKIPYVVGQEGTQPFYTRVKVSVNVTSAEKEPLDARYITLNYDETNWEQGADGWWYYRGEIGPGNRAALFTQVTFDPAMDNTYQNCSVQIDVSAQAVQVKNNPVPADGYTAITGWPQENAE